MERFNPIGPSSRYRMRRTSPFASLLLDLSSQLSTGEISKIKLALQVDKMITRSKICLLKHSADVFSYLYEKELILETDTYFLEQLLNKIGRKDLERKLHVFHDKRNNKKTAKASPETHVKVVDTNTQFTQLRAVPGINTKQELLVYKIKDISNHETCVKEVFDASITRPQRPDSLLYKRSFPDGQSHQYPLTSSVISTNEENKPPSPISSENSSPGDDFTINCSPMSVGSSQKSSQMSISDDEKVSFLNEKVWAFDTDDAGMSAM